VKKGHNGRKSLRRPKPTVGCNASKRRKEEMYIDSMLLVIEISAR